MREQRREEESKANEAQWTQKRDNCGRSPGRRKDELLECWSWFIHFLWEWKLAVDPSPLSVLNIWTDSGLASRHCVPLLTVSCPPLCLSYVSLLALVADVCSLRTYVWGFPHGKCFWTFSSQWGAASWIGTCDKRGTAPSSISWR